MGALALQRKANDVYEFLETSAAERIVDRLVLKGTDLVEARQQLRGLIEFLFASTNTTEQCGPGQLDDVWHVFILHTQEYMDFCDQYIGGYCHHNPTGRPSPQGPQNARQAVARFFGQEAVAIPYLTEMVWCCHNPD